MYWDRWVKVQGRMELRGQLTRVSVPEGGDESLVYVKEVEIRRNQVVKETVRGMTEGQFRRLTECGSWRPVR